MRSRRTVRAVRLGMLAATLFVLVPTGAARAALEEPVTSCGGTWYQGAPAPGEGYCELDFAGFPIRVEGTWAFDDPNTERITDIHIEAVVFFGPAGTPARFFTLSPGWACTQDARPVAASCEATYVSEAPMGLPVSGDPAVKIGCYAHRHSPASYQGSGTFRCSSGPA